MKDILVDQAGELRCPSCHGRNFEAKRTTRAKVTVGVGALLLPKRMKCMQCGTYAKVGDATPWRDPQRPDPADTGRPDPSPIRLGGTDPTVGVELTGSAANPAVTSSLLLRVLPDLGVDERRAIAAALARGETAIVPVPAHAAEEASARLGAVGITATVGPVV